MSEVWRKARASTAQGNCVEVRRLPDGNVAMRDSKDPDGPALTFNWYDIAGLLDASTSGELDDLGK